MHDNCRIIADGDHAQLDAGEEDEVELEQSEEESAEAPSTVCRHQASECNIRRADLASSGDEQEEEQKKEEEEDSKQYR